MAGKIIIPIFELSSNNYLPSLNCLSVLICFSELFTEKVFSKAATSGLYFIFQILFEIRHYFIFNAFNLFSVVNVTDMVAILSLSFLLELFYTVNEVVHVVASFGIS
jgi:hypothetical protein